MKTHLSCKSTTTSVLGKGLAVVLCFSLAACFALVGCSGNGSGATDTDASSGSASEEKSVLTVGMELAYPPFETKDDAGEPMGVSVDIIKAFGEAYGYDVVIENTAWDGLIPSLQTGKVDCIISSMTITEEREEVVSFSNPYAQAQLAILANASSGIASIDDLNQEGRRVAVKTGSTGDIFAEKNLTNAEIVRLADESACVTEVAQGKVDGFLYDQLTIYRNQVANPDTTTAIYIPFQDVEHWGIAVAQDNEKLLAELNEFIAQAQADGTFDEISEKHLSEERAAFESLGFTWFFDVE